MTPEDQLEFCLQEVAAGRKTVAECAALFPETPDLADQLQAAERLRTWPLPGLEPQASQNIERRLHQHLARRPRPAEAASGLRRLWPGRPSLALPQARRLALAAGLATVLAVSLMAGGGVVYAANDALPGDPLYLVKTTVEALRLAAAPSETEAADLKLEFADRRLEEVDALLRLHRTAQVPQALERYAAEVSAATEAVAQAPGGEAAQEARRKAEAELKAHQVLLRELGPQVPPQAQAALDRAQKVSGQALEGLSAPLAAPTETPKTKHTPEAGRTKPGPVKPTDQAEATWKPPSTPRLEPTGGREKGKPTDSAQPTPAIPKSTHAAPPVEKTDAKPGKDHAPKPSHTPRPTK